MDETNKMRIATGRYMNFFTDNGRCDIFIIINEANDVNYEDPAKDFDMVDELLRDRIDKMTDEEIIDLLEPVFEYGVQVIKNK